MSDILDFIFNAVSQTVKSTLFTYTILPLFGFMALITVIEVIKSVCIR